MKYWSLIFLGLAGFNLLVWQGVFASDQSDLLQVHFLDVGQGDSQLIILPGGAKFLIDGGPNKEVLFELSRVLPPTDRYIDMVFVTHSDLDHYGGLRDVIDRYSIGAFVFSGSSRGDEPWIEFNKKMLDKGLNLIELTQGDLITYGEGKIEVLSPNRQLQESRDNNDSSLVLKLESAGIKFLFTGDIDFDVEESIVARSDVNVDVLKVAHHGSRYSTGSLFLEEATPAISVIQTGQNQFGHPTQAILQRLWEANSSVYRNDEDGRVTVLARDGTLGVKTE